MIPFRPLSGQTQVYFVLFVTGFALAVLQNVTVDDAVLTGAVVPQYLPSDSVWNIGNTCTTCLAKPNASLAYNGTWHDTTYSQSNGFTQAIEFAFTGNALYIFFIIANNVTDATTLTDVQFILDETPVPNPYIHTPSSSTDYQYNVPVYANDSLVSGTHNMMIQPANSGNNVLILFDYLIYTMDTSSSVSTSASSTATSSSSVTSILPSSPTSSETGSSSAPNIGGIVGGTIGGVAALVVVAASLFCYRRHKRRGEVRPSQEEGAVDPFIIPREVDPTPLVGTTSSTHRTPATGLSITESTSRRKTGTSSTPQPSHPPSSNAASSSSGAASSGNSSALLEQVELLRGEVARLRDLHDSSRDAIELQTGAPPEYSQAMP